MARTPHRRWVWLLPVLATVGASADEAPALREAFEKPLAGMEHATLVEDGSVGRAIAFADPAARLDLGPCAFTSAASFTIRVHLRTRDPGFSTALIARAGEAVGAALVLGREPGRVSFEAWSWRSTKLIAAQRVDDGNWHVLEAAYDAATNVGVLLVDGRLGASGVLGSGGAPTAVLRLGNNIGAEQPFRGELDELEVRRAVSHPERFAALRPDLGAEERAVMLARIRAAALPARTPALDAPTAAAWAERARGLRTRFQDALGLDPWPARGPLDVQVHGRVAQGDLVVERITWNAWQGTRAAGWLWRPAKPPAGRLPGLLSPQGHWGRSDHPVEQERDARWARSGCVVLTPDFLHTEDVAAGVSALGLMTWNAIRALDVLAARDDVDPARLVATGGSGGGLQTQSVMVLDDRLAGAAPMVMTCYLREILSDTTSHCTCNHVNRLAVGTDWPELVATFAAKPLFVGSLSGDWTARFPREGEPELRRLYAALGRPEALATLHREGPHRYDPPFQIAARNHLFAQALDRPVPAGADEPFAPLDLYGRMHDAPPQRDPPAAPLAKEHLARRAPLRALSAAAPGLPWTVRRGELKPKPGETSGSWTRARLTDPTDGVALAVLYRGPPAPGDLPWTLQVHAAGLGTDLWDEPGDVPPGGCVAEVEPRFLGGWAPFAEPWRRNALMLGRGEGYQMAHDVALAAESLPGTGPVTLRADGEAGVAALIAVAAGLCPRVKAVFVSALGRPYAEDGNRRPQCPELLRWGDLDRLTSDARAHATVTTLR